MNKIKHITFFTSTLLCSIIIAVSAYAATSHTQESPTEKMVEAARLDVQKNEASIEKENSKEERYRLNIEPLLRVTVSVDEEDRLLTINWKDCIPEEATEVYVVVKGNRYDIYNASFNPSKVDSCQVQYETNIEVLEVRIYLQHGRNVYTEPIYKTVYVDPIEEIEDEPVPEEALPNEEMAVHEDDQVDMSQDTTDESSTNESGEAGETEERAPNPLIGIFAIIVVIIVVAIIIIRLRKK